MNLKPFNLEKALAGDPVITRDGQQVTEIFLCKTANKTKSSVVFVCNGKVYATTVNGNFDGFASSHDIFMAPKIVKKEGWIIIHYGVTGVTDGVAGVTDGNVYDTEENAKMNQDESSNRKWTTAKIEWEEEE